MRSLRLSISSGPAAYAMCAAISARVFCGFTMESASSGRSACISCLIGLLISLPVLLVYRGIRADGREPGSALFSAALLFSSLANASAALSTIVRSASYLALDYAQPAALILPALVSLWWGVTRNGDAIGYSAMVWIRIFPILLLIVVLLQFPCYRPAWLLPILGDGWPALFNNGVRAAGWIVSIAGIWPFCGKEARDASGSFALIIACAAAVAVAAGLAALSGMMTPPFSPGISLTWQMRLDGLLTNGRGPLYLQMPLIAIWYGALMHLMIFSGYGASALAQRLFPALDGRLCAALVTLAAAIFGVTHADIERILSIVSQWQFVVFAGFAAVAAARNALKGMKACRLSGLPR